MLNDELALLEAKAILIEQTALTQIKTAFAATYVKVAWIGSVVIAFAIGLAI